VQHNIKLTKLLYIMLSSNITHATRLGPLHHNNLCYIININDLMKCNQKQIIVQRCAFIVGGMFPWQSCHSAAIHVVAMTHWQTTTSWLCSVALSVYRKSSALTLKTLIYYFFILTFCFRN